MLYNVLHSYEQQRSMRMIGVRMKYGELNCGGYVRLKTDCYVFNYKTIFSFINVQETA